MNKKGFGADKYTIFFTTLLTFYIVFLTFQYESCGGSWISFCVSLGHVLYFLSPFLFIVWPITFFIARSVIFFLKKVQEKLLPNHKLYFIIGSALFFIIIGGVIFIYNQPYSVAKLLHNPNICNLMTHEYDKYDKGDCINELNFANAISTNNEALCGKMTYGGTIPNNKNDCYIKVANSKKDFTICRFVGGSADDYVHRMDCYFDNGIVEKNKKLSDLIIESVAQKYEPRNNSFYFEAEIKNVSDGYAIIQPFVSSLNVYKNGVFVAARSFGTRPHVLAPNEIEFGGISGVANGAGSLEFVVDPTNVIEESNENNNSYVYTHTSSSPIFSVHAPTLSVPTSTTEITFKGTDIKSLNGIDHVGENNRINLSFSNGMNLFIIAEVSDTQGLTKLQELISQLVSAKGTSKTLTARNLHYLPVTETTGGMWHWWSVPYNDVFVSL